MMTTAYQPQQPMYEPIQYYSAAPAFLPTPPAYELIPHRIFVGGFPTNTNEVELRNHFERYFRIREAKVIRSTEGSSKGYGFITFDTEEEAEAVKKLTPEELEFKGRKLNLGPALRKVAVHRFPPGCEYAMATPNGQLVPSPTFGYTHTYPPTPHYVMMGPPQQAFTFNVPQNHGNTIVYPGSTPPMDQQMQHMNLGGSILADSPQSLHSSGSDIANQPQSTPSPTNKNGASIITSTSGANTGQIAPMPCYPSYQSYYMQSQQPSSPVTPSLLAPLRNSPPMYNHHHQQMTNTPYMAASPDGSVMNQHYQQHAMQQVHQPQFYFNPGVQVAGCDVMQHPQYSQYGMMGDMGGGPLEMTPPCGGGSGATGYQISPQHQQQQCGGGPVIQQQQMGAYGAPHGIVQQTSNEQMLNGTSPPPSQSMEEATGMTSERQRRATSYSSGGEMEIPSTPRRPVIQLEPRQRLPNGQYKSQYLASAHRQFIRTPPSDTKSLPPPGSGRPDSAAKNHPGKPHRSPNRSVVSLTAQFQNMAVEQRDRKSSLEMIPVSPQSAVTAPAGSGRKF